MTGGEGSEAVIRAAKKLLPIGLPVHPFVPGAHGRLEPQR